MSDDGNRLTAPPTVIRRGTFVLVEEQTQVDLEPADTPGRGRRARGVGQVEPCRDRGVDLPHGADGDLVQAAGTSHQVRRTGRVQARQRRHAVARRNQAHPVQAERVGQDVPRRPPPYERRPRRWRRPPRAARAPPAVPPARCRRPRSARRPAPRPRRGARRRRPPRTGARRAGAGWRCRPTRRGDRAAGSDAGTASRRRGGWPPRTAGPVRSTSSCAVADTKVSVQPSDTPRPRRTSLTSRRERCSGVRPPGWGQVGTRRGTLE